MTNDHAFIEPVVPVFLAPESGAICDDIINTHGGATLAEIKEDGYRVQIHKTGDRLTAYTRNGNPLLLDLYPEIGRAVRGLPDRVLEGELLGKGVIGKAAYDTMRTRFRARINPNKVGEYRASGIIGAHPLRLVVFDTLRWEGTDRMALPIEQRRKFTERIDGPDVAPSEQCRYTDGASLDDRFTTLVGVQHEGLVCKRPGSIYVPGARNTDWIKLKRAEPFDLAVLGVYYGTRGIEQLLCGTYDPRTRRYESLAKVNARTRGLDKEIAPLLGRLRKTPPRELALNPIAERTGQLPDAYVSVARAPVVEVVAMNVQRAKTWHSCGLDDAGMAYSLRIAWLKGLRPDKSASQSTTTEMVARAFSTEVAA